MTSGADEGTWAQMMGLLYCTSDKVQYKELLINNTQQNTTQKHSISIFINVSLFPH